MPDQEQPPQKSIDQRLDDFMSALAEERKVRAEAEVIALRRHAEADERLKRLELRTEAHAMNLELLTIDIQQTRRAIDKLGERVDALTASMETMRQLQVVIVDLLRSHDARIGKLEQR